MRGWGHDSGVEKAKKLVHLDDVSSKSQDEWIGKSVVNRKDMMARVASKLDRIWLGVVVRRTVEVKAGQVKLPHRSLRLRHRDGQCNTRTHPATLTEPPPPHLSAALPRGLGVRVG